MVQVDCAANKARPSAGWTTSGLAQCRLGNSPSPSNSTGFPWLLPMATGCLALLQLTRPVQFP